MLHYLSITSANLQQFNTFCIGSISVSININMVGPIGIYT